MEEPKKNKRNINKEISDNHALLTEKLIQNTHFYLTLDDTDENKYSWNETLLGLMDDPSLNKYEEKEEMNQCKKKQKNLKANTESLSVGIVGTRNFNDYELMKKELKNFDIRKIISGGAKGADALAERYAKENSIEIDIYEADWETYGKSAGPKRNETIVEQSDMIIAFWDGKSKGTLDTIGKAKKTNKKLKIVYYLEKQN